MCALNIYVKSCGCRSEAASIGYCINAIATGRRCSQVQRREVHDSTSCARHSSHGYTSTSQPSRARSRSRSRSGDAFGGLFSASTSANRPPESSRSRPRESSRSRADSTATGRTARSGTFTHFDPTAAGYTRHEDDHNLQPYHNDRNVRSGTQYRQAYAAEPYSMPEHRSTGRYQVHGNPFQFYQERGSSNHTAYYTDRPGQGVARSMTGYEQRPSAPRSSGRSRRRSRYDDEDEDVYGGGRRRH